MSTEALKELDGVKDVSVDLKSGEVNLIAENEIAMQDIVNKLKEVDKTVE